MEIITIAKHLGVSLFRRCKIYLHLLSFLNTEMAWEDKYFFLGHESGLILRSQCYGINIYGNEQVLPYCSCLYPNIVKMPYNMTSLRNYNAVETPPTTKNTNARCENLISECIPTPTALTQVPIHTYAGHGYGPRLACACPGIWC